jgi:glycine C-acetyltransferase
MSKPMWALVYDRKKDPWDRSKGLRKEQVPRPTLDVSRDYRDAGMVVVRPRFAGFCGSDRGIWFRRSFGDMILSSLDKEAKDVRIVGHELLGEVVEAGPEATRDHGYKPGDVVSTESHIICNTCYQCRIGDNHVCATARIIGISLDGCFAEYVKLPAQTLWPTDVRKIRPEVAALQEPFGNAVHACTKVNLRGKSVAIIGCGTIGLFALLVARALGARQVIGVEPMKTHIEMAKKLGADAVVEPSKANEVSYVHDEGITQQIRDLTEGVGVDVAMEMSGSNAALNTALSAVRRGGHVILFGLKSGDAVIENLDRVIVEGITLHAVIGRRIFETWHITRSLLESRHPNIHDLIWEVILDRGQQTIVPFAEYEMGSFEEKIKRHPKVLLRLIASPQGAEILVGDRRVLNFCSNNYLGLSSHPRLLAAARAALDERGYGLSSVRFICGTQDRHRQLEERLARFFGFEDAILFSSCFDANGGVFEALLGEEDAVISDALNHASIIDGIRLCKAQRLRYAHADVQDLAARLKEARAARLKLVVTDGVFSMDGDLAQLGEICALAERHQALVMVDDSHASGFVGRTGRGTPEHFGVQGRVDLMTSTLGKALGGAAGGFVAARQEIVGLLRQRARPYLFSNTLAPSIVGASLTALDLLAESTALRDRLMENAKAFRQKMSAAGFALRPGIHPIVPIMLGEARLAVDFAQELLEEGIYVIGFSYPVVPRGEARIRVQLSAAHTPEMVERAVEAFVKVGRQRGVLRA